MLYTTSTPMTGTIVRAWSDGTRQSWVSDSPTSSATSAWGIWTGECVSTTSCTLSNGNWVQWSLPAQASPAPQQRESDRLTTAAMQRAERLLEELLTNEQVEQYRKLKKFHVISESGIRYEVNCQRRQHNIYDLDSRGNRVVEHCIYQEGDLPLPDNIAAQLLLLQTNEQEFRRIANQTRMQA